MAIDTIAGRLSALELFRGLDEACVERLAREADRLIFRDGQRLVEAGKATEGAIVIIAGRATALADPERGLEEREIEAGTLIGETAMLVEHALSVTIVASGDVRAVLLSRSTLQAHMQDDQALADHFASRLTARLQRMAVELRMIDERLAAAAQPSTADRSAA